MTPNDLVVELLQLVADHTERQARALEDIADGLDRLERNVRMFGMMLAREDESPVIPGGRTGKDRKARRAGGSR